MDSNEDFYSSYEISKIEKIKNKYNKKVDRNGKGKVFIVFVLVFMIISVIAIFASNNFVKNFKVDDINFKYVDKDNEYIYYKDQDGKSLIFKISGSRGIFDEVNLVYDKTRVLCKTEKIEEDDNSLLYRIVLVNDEIVSRRKIFEYNIYDENQAPFNFYELLTIKAKKASYKAEGFPLGLMIFASLILTLLGTSSIVYPKFHWKLAHFLSVEGGSPTELYVFMQVLSGIIFVLLAITLPIIFLLAR